MSHDSSRSYLYIVSYPYVADDNSAIAYCHIITNDRCLLQVVANTDKYIMIEGTVASDT